MSFVRLVVCSAIRNINTGELVCGPRHGNCLNSVVRYGLDKTPNNQLMDWQCGFVDQYNVFMTREEAWKVADAAGQIRRPNGFERSYETVRKAGIGDEGMLFSENLY